MYCINHIFTFLLHVFLSLLCSPRLHTEDYSKNINFVKFDCSLKNGFLFEFIEQHYVAYSTFIIFFPKSLRWYIDLQ